MTAACLQEYVHELSTCLLRVTETQTQAACDCLEQLSVETGSLLVCMALSNPRAFKAMQSARVDKEPFQEALQPESFYTGLLVSLLQTYWASDYLDALQTCFTSHPRLLSVILHCLICMKNSVSANLLLEGQRMLEWVLWCYTSLMPCITMVCFSLNKNIPLKFQKHCRFSLTSVQSRQTTSFGSDACSTAS